MVDAEAAAEGGSPRPAAVSTDEDDDADDDSSGWSEERRVAETLVAEMVEVWRAPIETLSKAGKAFEGLECLLGGGRNGTFDLKVGR